MVNTCLLTKYEGRLRSFRNVDDDTQQARNSTCERIKYALLKAHLFDRCGSS